MTTEDLIALLRQHPRESVGVAVHLGETTAFCSVERVTGYRGAQPRVLIHVEADVRIDEDAIYRVVRSALLLRGEHGGSHE